MRAPNIADAPSSGLCFELSTTRSTIGSHSRSPQGCSMLALVTMVCRLKPLLLFGVLAICACQPAVVSSGAGAEASGATPTATAPPTERPAATALPPADVTSESQARVPTPLPAMGGHVTIGGLDHLDALNPLRAESDVARSLMPLVYESMLSYDPSSGRLTPHLARSWQVAPDDRTITFTLRADARWPDGRPLAAGDVHSTIRTALDPATDSLYGARLNHVREITTPDDRTVVVSLDAPHCPSLAWLGELPILPRIDAGTSAATEIAPLTDTVPGSGAFALSGDSSPEEVHLLRNTQYWGDPPYLDAVTYRPYENVPALQSALERGEVDIAWLPADAQATSEPFPARIAEADFVPYLSPQYLFVAFNNQHTILKDRQVRLALNLAVDRQHLLQEMLGGNGALLAGSLPAGHWAADATLSPPPYDPDRARQLLAAAGWRDTDADGWLDLQGQPLRLPVRTNGGNRLHEQVATLVVAYYRAVGIDAAVEIVSWAVLVDDLFTHQFGAVVAGWPLTAEPDQSAVWLSSENEVGSGLNFVSFSDDEVDRRLQEAVTVPGCAEDRRAELYRRVQHRLADERPYDFLFIPQAALLVRSGLLGVEPSPYAGPFWNAADWHLGQSAQQ